jgi:hypothetical protein
MSISSVDQPLSKKYLHRFTSKMVLSTFFSSIAVNVLRMLWYLGSDLNSIKTVEVPELLSIGMPTT